MNPDFSRFSDRVLGILERSLKGQTLSRQDLNSWGIEEGAEEVWNELQAIQPELWLPVIRAVLNERRAHKKPKISVTWTGFSESKQPRDSALVLAELFNRAQSHIMLSAYHWDSVELFRPLKEAALRGVSLELYLNVEQHGSKQVTTDEVNRQLETFLEFWDRVPGENPFDGKIYFDSRVLLGHEWLSLHAKCAIIDAKILYVGSANLTQRGHERNIEAGLVVEDEPSARSMLSVFKAGPFQEWKRCDS